MRFSYLDGIRGMAALFVLARHWDELFRFHFQQSHLAVDLFFMLSGFVIAHAYDDKLGSGRMGPGEFMRLRFARLYPVYALSVVICGAYFIVGTVARAEPNLVVLEWLLAIALALCFLPYSVNGSPAMYSVNICFWSLALEMLVNVLYAYTRQHIGKRLLTVVVGVAGVLLIVVALATNTLGHGYLRGWLSFFGGFLRAVFGIGLGLLLYRHRTRLQRWTWNLPAWFSFPLLAVLMVTPSPPGYGWLVHLVAVFVVLPFAIIVAASEEPTRAWHARVLEVLGVASYPLYLMHVPFGHIVRKSAAFVHGWERPLAAAMTVLLFYLCLQLDKRFDAPVRTWLRMRLRGGGAVRAVSLG
ncbi:acyltransferase [[Empedobacter] haloabium]|uniref:Acyltransferase n=1 Tax=[Empedobacter] haloabium TaxID=592317 RepID=A0ABZ1UVD7_9BURK